MKEIELLHLVTFPVKTFRDIKTKISKEIKGMNFEQLKAYFEKTKLKPTAK